MKPLHSSVAVIWPMLVIWMCDIWGRDEEGLGERSIMIQTRWEQALSMA